MRVGLRLEAERPCSAPASASTASTVGASASTAGSTSSTRIRAAAPTCPCRCCCPRAATHCAWRARASAIDAGAGSRPPDHRRGGGRKRPDSCESLRPFLAARPWMLIWVRLPGRWDGRPGPRPPTGFSVSGLAGNEWNSQGVLAVGGARRAGGASPVEVVVIEAWADEATFYIWQLRSTYPSLPADRPPRLADFPSRRKVSARPQGDGRRAAPAGLALVCGKSR